MQTSRQQARQQRGCVLTKSLLHACWRRVKVGAQLPASLDRSFHPHQHIPQLLKWQSSPQQVNGPQLFKFYRRPLLPAGASLTLQLRLAPQQPAVQPPPPVPEPPTKDAGKCPLCQPQHHISSSTAVVLCNLFKWLRADGPFALLPCRHAVGLQGE